MEERTLKNETTKKGLQIGDLILIAVLIAAGAVLKLCVGSVVNFFGMKPNFIIAMYCLAIVLVRPNLIEAGVIGLLTGAVCQFLPGSPYINFISELLGALCMALMIRLPLGKLTTAVSTFVSTVVSGGSFTICLFLFMHAEASSLVAYVPIVLCTAVLNTVIVQILYLPLRKALKKDTAKAA